MKLNHLDLFSGIGGFSLGLHNASESFKTIAFVENDRFCQNVLRKNFPDVPIFENIRDFKTNEKELEPDIITAGFPCQPFSQAGKRNIDDDRNLWKETLRVVQESRPTWFIGENVNGIVKLYLDTILQDLADSDYSVRCLNIPASSVGAKHQRQRIWILAHSNERDAQAGRERQRRIRTENKIERASGDASSIHEDLSESENWWEAQSKICRTYDGISRELDKNRTKRLKALGNSLVPQIPYLIGLSIISLYADNNTIQTKGTSEDNS